MGCASIKSCPEIDSSENTLNISKGRHRISILIRRFQRKSSLKTISEVRSGLEVSSSKDN